MKNTVTNEILNIVNEVENNWNAERKGLSSDEKADLNDAHLLNFMKEFEAKFKNLTSKQAEKSLKDVFDALSVRWEAKTMFAPTLPTSSPIYLAIMALGKPVVPLILERVQENQPYWFSLLTDITGQNPASKLSVGNHDKTVQAWVEWAYKNNMLVQPAEGQKTNKQLRLF